MGDPEHPELWEGATAMLHSWDSLPGGCTCCRTPEDVVQMLSMPQHCQGHRFLWEWGTRDSPERLEH